MKRFGVPEPYREALVVLARLEADIAERLIKFVDEVPAFATVRRIQEAASDALDAEGGLDGAALVPPLLALRGQIRDLAVKPMAESLSLSRDLDLDEATRAELARRAAALLSSPAISTTAVAVDLQTRHNHNYQAARIFTDLRPVFTDDLADSPEGMVIVQMLEVQTWDRDGGSEALFVALDEHDLLQLQAVVERALKKTATIKRQLEAQNLAWFALEDEVDDA